MNYLLDSLAEAMTPTLFRRSKWAMMLTLAYAAALFWVNHVPLRGFDLGVRGGDKVMHFLAYAGLGVLLSFSFMPDRRGDWRAYLWLAGVAAAYGAVDEWLQYFVPSRHCDFADWVADMCGAALGLSVHALTIGVVARWLASWGFADVDS